MNKITLVSYLLISLNSLISLTSLACNVDVTIQEGNAITACRNIPNTLNAAAGFNQYVWSGAATGNTAGAAVISDGWAYVSATDNVGCTSIDSIFVTTFPSTFPTISSSEGVNICPTIGGTTLSLDQTYPLIMWSGGSTNPTLFVDQTGNYTAVVQDANGCFDSTSIAIDFIDFQLSALGGTTVCSGSELILQASGGTTYAWSTNEFSPSIVVAPTENTTYSVTIYQGACFETLSVNISVGELAEHDLPDVILVMPGTTEYVSGPANFDSFQWGPPELVSSVDAATTGYIGNTSGYVNLVATNNTIGCAMTHTIYFKLIELTIPEGFSPNGDGINDFFEIPEIFDFDASLKVWNRWGDIVFESDKYANDWDGTCKGTMCLGSGKLPEGTYFYTLTIGGNKFDAFVTIKL